MQDQYYSLPVSFGALLQKEPLQQVSLPKSVEQNLLLILMTHFEEYRYDYSYGCSIWDEDFELIPAANIWKGHLKRSIEASIKAHEKRLLDVKISITIGEEMFAAVTAGRRIKKRIKIQFSARLTKTDEPFHHEITLYLSPISLD